MEDDDLRPSSNIDDRRGMGGGAARGGLGIGAVLVLCLIGWATGIDPRLLIGGAEMVTGANQPVGLATAGPTRHADRPDGQFRRPRAG